MKIGQRIISGRWCGTDGRKCCCIRVIILVVNPEHLSEDTQSENEHEYVYKDQCRQGHLFDEDNTYQYLDRRICKACKRIRQLKKRIGRAKPEEPE